MLLLPETVDSIRDRYYRPFVVILSAIGLWPFGNKRVEQMKIFVMGPLFVLNLGAQLMTFITVEYTWDLFLKNISPMLIALAVLLKFLGFYWARGNIQLLIETLTCDWREVKNQEELEIIEKFTIKGTSHAKLVSLAVYPCSTCLALSPFASMVFDLIIPLNESRPHQFPIMYAPFLDQQEHFFFNAITFMGTLIVTAISLTGTEGFTLMLFQHACGLFAITSHRFERAFASAALKHEKSVERGSLEIIEAIRMHVKATSFAEDVAAMFGWVYFALIFIAISTMSINLYRLTQAVILFTDGVELLTSGFFTLALLEYMFFLNYIIQKVTDQSADVARALCGTEWYEAPVPMQKLMLFILLRTTRPLNFNIMGFFYPSIEGFSVIAQLSLSYFMVLISCQQA